MADSNQPIEWYLARDGQQHGPVTDAELRKIIELGYLRPSDLVWRQGMAEWALAEAVLDLRPASQRDAITPQNESPAHGAGGDPGVTAPHVRLEPEQGPGPAPIHRRPNAENTPYADHRVAAGQSRGYGPATAAGRGSSLSPASQGYAESRPGPRPHVAHRGGDYPAAHLAEPNSALRPEARAELPGSGVELHSRAIPAPRAPGPTASSTGYAQIDETDAEKRGLPWRSAAALVFLAGLAGGGFALHTSGQLTSLPFLAAPTASNAVPVVTRSDAPVRDTADAGATSNVSLSSHSGPASTLDAELQRSPVWQRLKRDHADWYNGRLAAVTQAKSEGKTEAEVDLLLTQQLVDFRQKHAVAALASSPEHLTAMARHFVEMLQSLAKHSVDACYGYISQGDTDRLFVRLAREPGHAETIEKYRLTVLEAIADGLASPQQHQKASRTDFEAVAANLGSMGWTTADLKQFESPAALAQGHPAKICKMVQDWYVAQLNLQDQSVRSRTLAESLPPTLR